MSAPSKAEILEEYAGQLGFTLQDWAEVFACYLSDPRYGKELREELQAYGIYVPYK